MGSNGSKLVKKILAPTNSKDTRKKHVNTVPSSPKQTAQEEDLYLSTETVVAKLPPTIGPLVMYRQGSMYFDEDGDLAHEFYVETKEGRKSKMKRVYNNLRPQGRVKLPFPRLHNDCPVILYAL